MFNSDDVYISQDRRALGKKIRLDSETSKDGHDGWLATTLYHPTTPEQKGTQRFVSQSTLKRFYIPDVVQKPEDGKFEPQAKVWITTEKVVGYVDRYLRDLHSNELLYYISVPTDKHGDWVVPEEELVPFATQD